ncbi:MAG TPA: hypothetical protein VFK86_09925, partial [Bauldia sp.]|nr:hypothetical protein [Bauldia sp.]
GLGEVSETALQKRGWQPGSVRSPDGTTVATPLRFYGKSGSNVVMMAMTQGRAGVCTVTAMLGKLRDVSRSVQFVRSELASYRPDLTVGNSGARAVFVSLPKLAILEATGTKDAPAVRVVVTYHDPEKK